MQTVALALPLTRKYANLKYLIAHILSSLLLIYQLLDIDAITFAQQSLIRTSIKSGNKKYGGTLIYEFI